MKRLRLLRNSYEKALFQQKLLMMHCILQLLPLSG